VSEGRRRVSTLQELVLSRLQQLGDETGPLPARVAAEKSRGRVSYETIRLIARGKHAGGISDRIAEGLAMALDVPLAEVYRVAGVQRPGSRWQWPERFDRLTPRQRELVEDFASALLEAYDQGRRDATPPPRSANG
jgi:hypothetical protein